MDVFFYGLFMDQQVLADRGIRPMAVRLARVPGYTLRIGARAAMVAAPAGEVHGVLMTLSETDVATLYSEPSVRTYRPAPVVAILGDGTTVDAVCYNLPVPPSPAERNPEYAERLRIVAERVGLPGAYVATIQ